MTVTTRVTTTRVHAPQPRPKVRLLCPCCGSYLVDWAAFEETYRRWRFGRADLAAFSQLTGSMGAPARIDVPYPALSFPYRPGVWRDGRSK